MAVLGNQHFNGSKISKLPCAITQLLLSPTHNTDIKMMSLDQDELFSLKLGGFLFFCFASFLQKEVSVEN